MRYEEITTRQLTKTDVKDSLLDPIVQQAKRLLAENLRDHEDTDLGFYEWVFIAQNKSGEVVGIITGNKYLPKKAMLCDIVTQESQRGTGVGLKLLKALAQHLVDNGIPYLIGFTSKNNASALKTYRRVGAYQDEFVVSVSDLNNSLAVVRQIEQRLKYAKERGNTVTKKSNLR